MIVAALVTAVLAAAQAPEHRHYEKTPARRALRAQKRDDEALAIESRFAKAWRRADSRLGEVR